MGEQLFRLQASTDLSEDLFNGLRDKTLQLDEQFGTEHTDVYWPGEIGAVDQNTEHFYGFSAHSGNSNWSMGVGMRGLGLQFELSHLATMRLAPDAALRYISEHVSRGGALVSSLAPDVQIDIRSANATLLFVSWQYAVNSFYPDVMAHNEIRLDIMTENGAQSVLHQIDGTETVQGGLLHFLPQHRQAKAERSEVQRLHIAGHIEHILERLHWF